MNREIKFVKHHKNVWIGPGSEHPTYHKQSDEDIEYVPKNVLDPLRQGIRDYENGNMILGDLVQKARETLGRGDSNE